MRTRLGVGRRNPEGEGVRERLSGRIDAAAADEDGWGHPRGREGGGAGKGGVWVVAELHQLAAHADDRAEAAGFGPGFVPDEVERGRGFRGVVEFHGADLARSAGDLERETTSENLQLAVPVGRASPP